jgi:hypothetical protein
MSIISEYTTLTQELCDNYTWPVYIDAKVIVAMDENLTFTSSNNYFIINGESVQFNGNGYTITIENVTNYLGVIQNGTITTKGYSNFTITDLTVSSSGSTLLDLGGWIGQSHFGNGSSNNMFSNCSSTGNINSNISGSGGILGGFAGVEGEISATGCFSSGAITGNYAGGIFGASAGNGGGGNATAINCYSSGVITGQYAGGIFGSYAGEKNGNATAQNCYSIGDINGSNEGGIFGFAAGNATAINCYSTGTITGDFSGGIAGSNFGFNANECSITACYSTGNITGANAGGIVGSQVGYNTNVIPKVNISNCYVLGSINSGCGGICGGYQNNYTNFPTVTVSNCYVVYTGDLIAPSLQNYFKLLLVQRLLLPLLAMETVHGVTPPPINILRGIQ